MSGKLFLTRSREQSKRYATSRSDSYKNTHEKCRCEWKITIWLIFSVGFFGLFVCLNFQISRTEGEEIYNSHKRFLLHSLKPTGSSPPTCPPLYVYEFMHCFTQTIYMPDTKQSSLSLYIAASRDEIPLSHTHTHTHTLFPSVKGTV